MAGGWGKWGDTVQEYKLPIMSKLRGYNYSIVTTVSNTVMHTSKLLKA